MTTGYIDLPVSGGITWKDPVANAAALPTSNNNDGDARVTLNDQSIYIWKSGTSTWIQSANPGVSSGITALNTDVVATGPGAVVATIQPNVVTNAKLAQMPTLTIKGNNTGGTANALDLTVSQVNTMTGNSGDVTLGTANGLSLVGQVLSLALSSTSTTGALSSTDWNTFNGKQASGNYITALTGDATASGPGSAALTLATVNSNVGSFGSASNAVAFTVNAKGLVTAASATAIQIAESQVTNLVSDLAGKQPTGNYITALTGDATASGPGSAALTFATVNSNVGSFGSASSSLNITVNAKGLVTAASTNSIQIAESQVTNLVSDLAGKQPTGNYMTALTGDVTAAGPGSSAATLATVNSNVGSFTNASITVNGKGLVTAASSGTAPATGTGASGRVTYWSGTSTLTSSSSFLFDGTNFGIGATPQSLLTVSKQSSIQAPVSGSIAQYVGLDANPLRLTYDTHNNASASGTAFMVRRSRGTSATPLAVSSGDVLGSFNGRGYGATGYAAASTGLLSIKANQSFTDSAMGTYVSFDTTPDGSVTAAEAWRMAGTGALSNTSATGTAYIHLKAGTTAANTAPIKLTPGTVMTIPEQGSIESDSVSLYFTPGASRYSVLFNNLGLSGGQTVVGGTASGNALTLSSTSNATKGNIVFGANSVYDEVNDRLGINNTAPASRAEFTTNALGTSVTDASGIVVSNNTAATSGVTQQASPGVRLRGSAWTSTSLASHTADWRISQTPVVGASTILSTLNFGWSENGGAYTNPMALASGGNLSTTGSINAGTTMSCTTLTASLAVNTTATNQTNTISGTMAVGQSNGLFVYTSTGVNANFTFGGAAQTMSSVWMRFGNTATPAANNSYSHTMIGGNPVTINASGTHPVFATLGLAPITINTGNAVTNATTLYIQAAPTSVTGVGTASAMLIASGKAILAASTTTAATVNYPAGTAPTSPVEGDMWADSTQKTEIAYLDGIKQARNGCILTGTATKTVTNTTTQTSLVPTGVGTATLPANFFVAGKTVRIRGAGVFSTDVVPGNVTIAIKYGSTTIATGTITNILSNAANNAFDFQAEVACRTTGASGTVMVNGIARYDTGTLVQGALALNNAGATTTIDTTASSLLDVLVTWATASAANTISTTTASFEVIN